MIEQILERIAVALEKIANPLLTLPAEAPAKPARVSKKNEPKAAPVADAIPGVEDAPQAPQAAQATGAELRALAQQYIAAAEQSDPGGKNGAVNKLVTFIQSVAKIFNPGEPKLIKIPDAKVPEAAAMITGWAEKNGLKLPIEV